MAAPKTIHESAPFEDHPPTPQEILDQTRPPEAMSRAHAEVRLAEILAHITSISREIEDRSQKRGHRWASDPHESWRKAAMAARDELYKQERALRAFVTRCDRPASRAKKEQRVAADLARQEVDRSTRDARKLSKHAGEKPLWDLYLKAEVTLLSIRHGGGIVGPLGESLLYSSQQVVPEWYRDHWLHTVYGTTWGRQAEALRENEQ